MRGWFRQFAAWASAIVADLSLAGCDSPPSEAQRLTYCGAAAIACYDELGADDARALSSFRLRTRWGKTHLTWRFGRTLPGMPRREFAELARTAIATWDAACALSFEEVGAETLLEDADILISFLGGDHGDPFPFVNADGASGNVLAHTFYPGTTTAGHIHLDEFEQWVAEARFAGDIDLPTVLLHEIGHALGLAHSRNDDDVMSAAYSGRRTALTANDIASIQRIYGSADGRVAPAPNMRPGEFDAPPRFDDPNQVDNDGDGVPDPIEVFALGTDPFVADTDGDGVNDYDEVFVLGTDARVVDGRGQDRDGDGLTDEREQEIRTDADLADTDGDGISDGPEVSFFDLDPLNPDTDGDGFLDGAEPWPTNPFFPQDCNSNGIPDGQEVVEGAVVDADGDGRPDECTLPPPPGAPSPDNPPPPPSPSPVGASGPARSAE